MQIAWTPYTTPTPLPNRPNWNATDWKKYFTKNHPNFWFKEKLKEEKIAALEKEKLIKFMSQQVEEKNNVNVIETADASQGSKFFKNPLQPQPEEWLNWPPERWVEWSQSEEYRDLYTSPSNIYRPSGVEQPESPPVLGYWEKMPVILTQWSTPTPTPERSNQGSLIKEGIRDRNKEVIRGKVSPPPETFFPDPTQSPTEDPNYIYRVNYNKNKPTTRSQLSDIKPQFVINEPKKAHGSISSDYLYNKNFESSGLPNSEYSPASNLDFERYKDRDSLAVNPSLLLLTKKPNYAKDGLPAAELAFDIFNEQLPLNPSFQEGLSPERFETSFVQTQGSVPAEGDPQDPKSRPPAANTRKQQNRFRPAQFRPGRPGQSGFQGNTNQRINPNLPDNSNLSPEVHLPPINQNNPNFQNIYKNQGPQQINPYHPPNNPGYFQNQYQPPQGASSSTSTSTGGGGSSAAASSSAGFSSSSSTSVSDGGNNNNDNKYSECTGPQCSSKKEEEKPFSLNDENRNVFFSEETTSTTTRSPLRETNLLENITFPNGGDQQINLNIPEGVTPPPDLQEAIDRGGDINLNCDRTNGCPTLIPPQDRLSTTQTTTRAPVFRVSISPLFGNIRSGNSEEETSSGIQEQNNQVREKLLANSASLNNEATDELPLRGLGDDYVNEVYELDSPTSFSRPAAQGNRVATIGSDRGVLPADRVAAVSGSRDRVADIPPVQSDGDAPAATAEDLKSIVQALSGLIQLLNNTGRRNTKNQNSNLTQPFGLGHLGGKRYPVKNIIFDEDATFSKIKSQNVMDGDIIYYNIKKNLPSPQYHNIRSHSISNIDTTTIPPHLIPLGSDGSPLVEPNGSFISSSSYGQRNKLSQMFPYLSDKKSYTTTIPDTTTSMPTIGLNSTVSPVDSSNNTDNRDMITRTIDMIQAMPMSTRRHMLANMVVGVPMAAITMVAAGLPPLGNISQLTFLSIFIILYYKRLCPCMCLCMSCYHIPHVIITI